MWESYVGGIISLSLITIFSNIYNEPTFPIGFVYLTLSVIPGFLIGWGIHNLVRKLRRRR